MHEPPALLLIPGLMCDAGLWAPLQRHLPAAFTCQVADHGTLASLPAMAHSALVHTRTERFWLAGHSMGGRVALEILRQAPERVRGVALMDTGWAPLDPGAPGDAERARRLGLVELARSRGMRATGEQWAPDMVHPQHRDTPLYEGLLAMIERSSAAILEAQTSALLDRPDATGVLATIRCPALVLCGRQDRTSPVAQHVELAARIPDARLQIIEAAGHMLPLEQPEETAGMLVRWIRGQGEPPPCG